MQGEHFVQDDTGRRISSLGVGGGELVEFGEEGGGLCLTLWEWEPRYAAPRLVVHWRRRARADAHA